MLCFESNKTKHTHDPSFGPSCTKEGGPEVSTSCKCLLTRVSTDRQLSITLTPNFTGTKTDLRAGVGPQTLEFLPMFSCCNMQRKYHRLQGTCCQVTNQQGMSRRLLTGTVKDKLTHVKCIISEQTVRSDPTICSFRYNPLAKLLKSPEHLPT